MIRFMSTLLALVLMQDLNGQSMTGNGDDFFQAMGKMYVVVAIIVVIFIGIILYLWRLDRKISQLENKQSK